MHVYTREYNQKYSGSSFEYLQLQVEQPSSSYRTTLTRVPFIKCITKTLATFTIPMATAIYLRKVNMFKKLRSSNARCGYATYMCSLYVL